MEEEQQRQEYIRMLLNAVAEAEAAQAKSEAEKRRKDEELAAMRTRIDEERVGFVDERAELQRNEAVLKAKIKALEMASAKGECRFQLMKVTC
jgi:Skp family chaperone for outer membrane proteins